MNIPDEVVEAAAKVLFWQDEKPETMAECKKAARQLLEAAAPHMQTTSTVRYWVARTKDSILGNFRTEEEANRWADKWNEGFTGNTVAYVERTPCRIQS